MSKHERTPGNQKHGINPKDMPPLDGTAEVPLKHSEDVNSEKNWRGVQKTFHGKKAKLKPEQTDDVLLGRAAAPAERPGFVKRAVIGTTAVLATGVGVVGYNTLGGDDTEPSKPQGSNSAPANPGESKGSTQEQEQTVEFGISAAEFRDNPEALATEYYEEQYNPLLIAGINKEMATSSESLSTEPQIYVIEKTQHIDQEFINELFVPDWQDNPRLAEYVGSVLDVAHSVRWARMLSSDQDGEIPYERKAIPTKVTGTVDPLTTSVRWRGEDNQDVAQVGNLTGVDPNTLTGGGTFTWVEVDGKLKISDVTYYEG